MKTYLIPSTQVDAFETGFLMLNDVSRKGDGPDWNPLDPGSGDVG